MEKKGYKNPFIVQRPIKYGEPFCNRKREMELLEGAAARSEAVCILSIRRFGKSSLANQIIGRLEEKGWLTLRVDLSRCYSAGSLARELAKGLDSLQGRWRALIRDLKDAARIRPQITFDPLTSQPAIGFDFSRPADELEQVKNILRQIVTLPDKAGPQAHLCLVLDEFQSIRRIDPKGRLEWLFRAEFQERGSSFVPFLLGSERHLLEMMIYEESSAFFKSVTPLGLETLPEEELLAFVMEQFQSTIGRQITGNRIRGIYRIFGGHPYAINWFFSELWDLEERSSGPEPLETWVEIALRIILNQRQYYEALNSRLPLGARKVLLAIAAHEPVKRLYSRDFMVNACGMAQGSLQSAIKVLKEEDKIKKTPRGYVINDPLERLVIAVADLDEEALAGFIRARIEQAGRRETVRPL